MDTALGRVPRDLPVANRRSEIHSFWPPGQSLLESPKVTLAAQPESAATGSTGRPTGRRGGSRILPPRGLPAGSPWRRTPTEISARRKGRAQVSLCRRRSSAGRDRERKRRSVLFQREIEGRSEVQGCSRLRGRGEVWWRAADATPAPPHLGNPAVATGRSRLGEGCLCGPRPSIGVSRAPPTPEQGYATNSTPFAPGGAASPIPTNVPLTVHPT